MSLLTDLRFALRSLARVKGLAFTVIVTLALGIGANAAIFSVVRGVLLRPLVNRDEERLDLHPPERARHRHGERQVLGPRDSATCKAGVKTLTAFGDFSTIEFTMVGLGEPRVVRAGVVGGIYFEVMGLRPVLGRLLGPATTGRSAAGAAVLTHRFWTRRCRAIRRCSARPCGSAIDRRRSSACSNRRCRIRRRRKSSPTS